MESQTNGSSEPSLSRSDSDRVRTHLAALLASPEFASSGRKAGLLRYLVERTLNGEGSTINEFGIGLDVFERPESFDPRIDSLVRAEISRLRVKLKGYYSGGGQSDPIVIELPPRSYVPKFTFRDLAPAAGEIGAARRRARGWLPWAVVATIVILAAAAFTFWKMGSGVPGSIRSLVVLPFQNYSQNHQDEYLADGITEELTNQLAQWRELRVVARTSALLFKNKAVDIRQIGRQLNVDAVLEGSCVKQGDRIRITAQLSRSSDGYHLWSRSFESRSEDMLALQDQMARAIATAVHGVSSGSPSPAPSISTNNPAAHDLYLRASAQLARHTPESYRNGLELLHSAIAIDPAYVSAYLGIARAEIALIHITAEAPKDGLERAREALRKAMDLDPQSSEAHGAMASLIYLYDWDWPQAEREYKLALDHGGQALTHSYYGWGLATRGRFEEAQRQFRTAQDLDPLGMGPRFNQAIAYYLEHNYRSMRRVLQQMLDAEPDLLDAHLMLGLLGVEENDCGKSTAEMDWSAKRYQAPVTKFGLAMASACRGDTAQARLYLAEAAHGGSFVSPYQLALGYSYLHDNQAALSYLEKSADAKEGQVLYMKYEPFFDGLRSDPRFTALEKRVGLDP